LTLTSGLVHPSPRPHVPPPPPPPKTVRLGMHSYRQMCCVRRQPKPSDQNPFTKPETGRQQHGAGDLRHGQPLVGCLHHPRVLARMHALSCCPQPGRRSLSHLARALSLSPRARALSFPPPVCGCMYVYVQHTDVCICPCVRISSVGCRHSQLSDVRKNKFT
jgi:hypothetical protein